MFSRAETIPTRNPTTTRTTRIPIVTQVHIQLVSAPAPLTRPGAACAAVAMIQLPSLFAAGHAGRRNPLVDAAGEAFGGLGLSEDVAGIGLDRLGDGDRAVEVGVDLGDVVVDPLRHVEDRGGLGVDRT